MKIRSCDLALPIPKKEYLERQEKLDKVLNSLNLDGIILCGPAIFYFTGYPSRAGDGIYIHIKEGDRTLFLGLIEVDQKSTNRYNIFCDNIIPQKELSIIHQFNPELIFQEINLNETLKKLKIGFGGINFIQNKMKKFFEKKIGSLKDYSNPIWEMRKSKSLRELEIFKAAYYAISDTLNEGIKASDEGLTQGELNGRMANTLFSHGFDEVSKIFSINSGFNIGALSLNKRNNTITEDTPLTLNAGGIFYGYTAQASRTIIGKRQVNSKFIDSLKTLYNSIEIAFQASGPKATLKTISNAAMKELRKKIEPESCFGILHSTGIEFYEPPICTFENPTNESLKKGMILSLELSFSNKNIKKEKLKIIDCFQITDNGAQRILRGILTDPPLQITHHNFE